MKIKFKEAIRIIELKRIVSQEIFICQFDDLFDLWIATSPYYKQYLRKQNDY